jgi:hypothetical protein
MTNDYRITSAERWDGPHGTGWHQDLAGQGKHAERSRLAKATRIRGQQQGYMPAVHVEADQFPQFVSGFVQAERDRKHIGTLGGAILGAVIGNAVQRRRTR